MIKWGVENGQHELDLGRTSAKSGVFLFKKRWGGTMKKIEHLYRFYGKESVPDFESPRYNALKSIMKIVPASILSRIGPRIRRNFP